MNNSPFTLTQGAGQKLEFAIQRTGGTGDDVDYLSTADNFNAVILLRTGKAKLVTIPEGGEPKVVPMTGPAKYTVDADGNIHFTVVSNGKSGEEWITYFERDTEYRVSDYAKDILRRATEAPTNGVSYHIVVRPGSKIAGSDRVTKKIRAAADGKGWKKPHWEVGPLIRDMFTDKELEEMGLWYIVAMHEPIKDSDGDPDLLCSYRDDDGRWLSAHVGGPDGQWDARGGFAFVVPQESASTSVPQS